MLEVYPMSFRELNKGKVFSLPDKMDTLKITLQEPVGVGISGNINIMWLHNNYMKFFKNSNPFWTKCYPFEKRFYNLGYRKCLNISFVKPQYHYIIYSKEFSFLDFERLKDTSSYISWSEASELCREVDGYLPYFTSRKELDELLAFLKLSPEIHPIEALYIGLTSNPLVKQSFFLKYK